MGKGIWDSMKNKANEYCIGLYSDYDFSNMTYEVTIGAEVTKADSELKVKKIPGGDLHCLRLKVMLLRMLQKLGRKYGQCRWKEALPVILKST